MLLKTAITTACVAFCGALLLDGAAAETPGGRALLRGRTAQKRAIKLAVHGSRIQLKHFTARLRCRGGAVLIDVESGFQPTPVHGTRFHDVQFGSTDEVLLRGTVHGHRVSGKVRVKDELGGKKCDSRWVRFAAHD